MTTKVIIDSSYYNFYRFFATISWYNYDPERKESAEGLEWIDNDVFMKTFEKMWFENITKICKKFAVETKDLIFARDGNDSWRYKLYPHYKATRKDNSSAGLVFKKINAEFHSRLPGANVLRVSKAEGDDIIAVTTRYIRNEFPNVKIVIITGDHDFLQLSEPGWVEIYQLKGWKQITSKNPRLDLMLKILAGDASDNIPPIYKGCGKKTAERLANNPEELEKILKQKGVIQYNLNRILVDFDYIPDDIVYEIETLIDKIF